MYARCTFVIHREQYDRSLARISLNPVAGYSDVSSTSCADWGHKRRESVVKYPDHARLVGPDGANRKQ
jgi:hypothetical protein